MEVDVQDGDPRSTLIEKHLRCDGGVVEKTVAAIEVACGVVTGRAAERKRRTLAIRNQPLCGLHHGAGRLGRAPGTRGYRGLISERVVAQFAVDVTRAALLHAARWKDERQGLTTVACRDPFVPTGLEKAQKTGVMDLPQGCGVELCGWRNIG